MNRTEAAMLLAYAAARDNRKADPAAAEAWYEDLGDLNLDDCKAAVRHHMKNSHEYLMPVHIRDYVKVIRAERVRAAGDLSNRVPAAIEAMDDGPEQLAAEQAWLREAARQIADGADVDHVAPRRLRLVPGKPDEAMKAITDQLAKQKRAPGTKPRDETA